MGSTDGGAKASSEAPLKQIISDEIGRPDQMTWFVNYLATSLPTARERTLEAVSGPPLAKPGPTSLSHRIAVLGAVAHLEESAAAAPTAAVHGPTPVLGFGSGGAPLRALGVAVPPRRLCEPFKQSARHTGRARSWMRLLLFGKKWRLKPAFGAPLLQRAAPAPPAHRLCYSLALMQ